MGIHPVGDADRTKADKTNQPSTATAKPPWARQAEMDRRVIAFKAAQKDAKTQDDASGWHSGAVGWNPNNNTGTADTAKAQPAVYMPGEWGVRASNAVLSSNSEQAAYVPAQNQPQRSIPELRADHYITNRTYGGVLDINGLAKNLRDVAQEPGGQATVDAVMKRQSPEVQAQLKLRMGHSRKVSEFFDPVRDNPHFETLKKAGLLGKTRASRISTISGTILARRA